MMGEFLENSPAEKKLGVLVDEKHEAEVSTCSPQGQRYPGLHQRGVASREREGGDCPPLFCPCEACLQY